MAIIRPPVTGDMQLDSWMDLVTKQLTISSLSADSILNSELLTSGINPVNTATLVLYKRYSEPVLPPEEYLEATTVYTYATTTLVNKETGSPLNFDGWTRALPDVNVGRHLFAIQVNIADLAPTETIAGTDWSNPILISSESLDGEDGQSTYHFTVYRRSPTEITEPPTGGSYTFGTNVPVAPDGWSDTIPANTGYPLYQSSAVASIVGNVGTDDDLDWSVPTVLAVDGESGEPAPRYYAFRLWYQGNTAPTAPTATFTWDSGVLSNISEGWQLQGPTIDADGSTVAWFSDIIVEDYTGAEESTVATGTTPQRAINFDGIVTFTNNGSITDGENVQAFGILAEADSVDLGTQVSGELGTANASADLINSNIDYETLGTVPELVLENVAAAINSNTTTIDGAKITTGTVNTDVINANSGNFNVANIPDLSANKITSGFIASERIEAGTIDSKILNVDAATITSGVLDTAVIGDASIGTLKLGDQAVTIPKSSFVTGTVNSGTALVDLASVTYTSSGAPVVLFFSTMVTSNNIGFGGEATATLEVYRGTTLLHSYPEVVYMPYGQSTTASLSILDEGNTAGVVTYYVKAKSSANNGHTWELRNLTTLEVKR